MQDRDDKVSRDALYEFLEFMGGKGLLKKTTASARKDASKTILGILDENEAVDLSKVDLESVIQRHRNIATSRIKPRTLTTYESRTRTAVRDFLEYVENPSGWKPSTKQRASRVGGITRSTKMDSKDEDKVKPPVTGQPSVHIDLQVHISPEASAEQIDQIFASMSRHLYGGRTGR